MPKSPLKYSTHHHHYNVGNMLRVVHSTPSFFLVYDCGLLFKKSTNVHFRPFLKFYYVDQIDRDNVHSANDLCKMKGKR